MRKDKAMQTTTRTLHDAAGAVLAHDTQVAPAPYSSVEIALDSKGVAKPVVKVYHEDANEAASQALALYRKLVTELQQ
jgi:hypothetical protein